MRQGEDLTEGIERLPAFEERAGVTLDKCSAYVTKWSSETLRVAGEILPLKGTLLQGDIDVLVSVYDDRGRVIGTASETFDRASYYGFDTFFMEYITIPAECEISKVRVFPRPT